MVFTWAVRFPTASSDSLNPDARLRDVGFCVHTSALRQENRVSIGGAWHKPFDVDWNHAISSTYLLRYLGVVYRGALMASWYFAQSVAQSTTNSVPPLAPIAAVTAVTSASPVC